MVFPAFFCGFLLNFHGFSVGFVCFHGFLRVLRGAQKSFGA